MCFNEKYGQSQFGPFCYTIISFFGIFSSFLAAVLICMYNEDNGIADFNSLEFALLTAIYCAIMFYRTTAGKEFLDRIFSGCIGNREV
jgi:uncharacterized membrane protein